MSKPGRSRALPARYAFWQHTSLGSHHRGLFFGGLLKQVALYLTLWSLIVCTLCGRNCDAPNHVIHAARIQQHGLCALSL